MSAISRQLSTQLRGDRPIWWIVAILSVCSVLAVYSATSSLAHAFQGGNTERFLLRHTGILAIGLVLMYGLHLVNYTFLLKWANPLMWIAGGLLVITFFMGTNINEARRWLELPVIGSFQSSDFAKGALIIYVAKRLSEAKDDIKDFEKGFKPIILPVIGFCALIAPSNLSTAAILFFTCWVLMLVGRIHIRFIAYTMLAGLAAFMLLIVVGDLFPGLVRSATWAERLNDFLNGDGGYQVQQAKIAISRGGWIGVGPGNGTQAVFLPAAYSDYIYAVILEEYGLVGGLLVLGMYVWLLFRCARLVTRRPKAFGSMLAIGFCIMIVFQALANMAVAVNLIPVTGQTLPLVSMGGTSVLTTLIALGLVQSVSRVTKSGA